MTAVPNASGTVPVKRVPKIFIYKKIREEYRKFLADHSFAQLTKTVQSLSVGTHAFRRGGRQTKKKRRNLSYDVLLFRVVTIPDLSGNAAAVWMHLSKHFHPCL